MKRVVSALGGLNTATRALAVLVLWATATAISLPAQVLTTLHRFNNADGQSPNGGLVQATDGNFYGTTYVGGAYGQGTVFKITPRGMITTLHSFTVFTDGQNPNSLIQAADGALYGTTVYGGGIAPGSGTFFKITLDGTLTTLHIFTKFEGSPSPLSALIQATDGNFYGTTNGTIFRITPSGVLTTLYTFCSQPNCADGYGPIGALVQGADGDLYGTTSAGGTHRLRMYGAGTAFKITLSGVLTTLYEFCSQTACVDGENPEGPLVQADDGELYGTTIVGGAKLSCLYSGATVGCGTIFKITPDGTLTTLYSFDGPAGSRPFLPFSLVQGGDGNFYGITSWGGANQTCTNGCGTIFKITPTGQLTTLHNFDNATDGYDPTGPLVEAKNGSFYGTTQWGSSRHSGTVFSLEVFVKTLPTSGAVGSAVKILGTDLTGATSVTFNGVAAVFQVAAPNEITTTVPPGASTGEVQVVFPGGTLSSVRPFQVP